jgi:hypothetical protein
LNPQVAEETRTVRQLLRRWAAFVRQVEAGYDDTIYDYTNDLSVRDLLEEKLSSLPPADGDALRAELRPWDDRFEAATRPSIRPVAPGVRDREYAWWFRVPLKLSEELASDLRSEGVIR